MKKFSKKWTYDTLKTGVSKLKRSNINSRVKKIAEDFPLFVTINCQLRVTAGQLYVIRNNDWNANKIPLDKKDWAMPIDGINSYMCLELSAHHIYWDSAAEVRNTILHECAHAINFIDEGYEYRSAKDWHSNSWKDIHLALGEKPNEYCDPPYNPANLAIYHEMANNFEEEMC